MHAQRFPCIQRDLVHPCSQFQVSREVKNGRTCRILLMMGSIVNTTRKDRSSQHIQYCSLCFCSLYSSQNV
ncbi:unnamed protein product [Staurois parvus]|uniref:Uncharacterized protein n=1 Tax=Staurois parvus TaxID=386267 RepID=A0ABN9C504_9NEOB|nr:unnamed protein product [Staurois parvus]